MANKTGRKQRNFRKVPENQSKASTSRILTGGELIFFSDFVFPLSKGKKQNFFSSLAPHCDRRKLSTSTFPSLPSLPRPPSFHHSQATMREVISLHIGQAGT